MVLRREESQPAWTHDELNFVVDTLNQIIPAIENARLLEDAQRSAALIDSPGFQEFGLAHCSLQQLAAAMPEFTPLLGGCRFNDCSHSHEPRCAVRDAAERGEIAPERYATYLRILESLAAP